MNAKKAVAQRIMELCKSRNITINTLANDAGVPPTTIYNFFLKLASRDYRVSLREFFDSPIFDDLEQEIQ